MGANEGWIPPGAERRETILSMDDAGRRISSCPERLVRSWDRGRPSRSWIELWAGRPRSQGGFVACRSDLGVDRWI